MKLARATTADLVRGGLEPEFVGRIPVRVALGQRLPDDLARLIFNDYFRHHLRECRHLGYEMHYRLKMVCRALKLDTRGNGLVLKKRIFDELGG